jgi:D-amino peptidase
VPTVFVSGDEACAAEARALVPEIETAAVKAGIRRGSAAGLSAEENERFNQAAIHLHPEKARELIRSGAERAVRRHREIPPFTLEAPYEYVTVTRPSRDRPGEVGTKTSDDIVALLGWPAPATR